MHLESNRLDGAAVASALEGLGGLRHLHLDRNRIGALAGLEAAPFLEELTLADQEADVPLSLSPASLAALGPSLRALDVSGCRVRDLSPFFALGRLERFACENNDVDDLSAVAELVAGAPALSSASFSGCPVAAGRTYRQRVIGSAGPLLQSLDGATVTEQQKDFLKRLGMRKAAARAARAAPAAPAGVDTGGTAPGASRRAARPTRTVLGGGYTVRRGGPAAAAMGRMPPVAAWVEEPAKPASAAAHAHRLEPAAAASVPWEFLDAPVPTGGRAITPAAPAADPASLEVPTAPLRDVRTPWGVGPGLHRAAAARAARTKPMRGLAASKADAAAEDLSVHV